MTPIASVLLALAVLALVHWLVKTVLPFARIVYAVSKLPGAPFKFPTGTVWWVGGLA